MNYHILTLFPEMVLDGLNTSIIGRAAGKGLLSIEAVNIRDYTKEKHGHVDDTPYGGGAGMVMQAAPVCDAYEALCERIGKRPRVLYMTPQGQTFNQKIAEELAQEEDLVFLCGHYAINHSTWNNGYRTIALFQIVLTLILFFSLPLWQKPSADASADENSVPEQRSFSRLIRVPGVKEVLTCFFCYCAVESTAGMWAASYCTLFRGIDAKRAASWASLFYVGITIGRFFCGFITMKLNDQKMIRLGQAVIAVGTILMLLPLGDSLLFIGLILIGLGCAPIYPSIIHETPANFGADLSQGIIGIQMAFAYVGTCLMPPVFGVLGQHISFGLYPVFLMAILILMVVMAERMHRVTAEKRNSYKANY